MKTLLATAAVFAASQAAANEPFGIWETIKDPAGAYFLVDVQPCESDNAKLCGNVAEVVNSPADQATLLALIGRPVFWDLEKVEENKWANGKVWDAVTDTVYDSRVTLGKTAMRVEGCVMTFCDGGNWKRPAQ